MAIRYDDPYEDWGISYDTPAEPAPAAEPAEYPAQGDFKPIDWTTKDWMQNAIVSSGLQDSPLAQTLGYSPAADSQKAYEQSAGRLDVPKEDNVFERISGKLGKGVSDAFDKDPLKFLEMGLGGIAGVYKAKQARDAAAMQSQSAVDVVHAKAAAEKDAQDRYAASFSLKKRAPVVAKPLTRMNGAQVWDANGRLKG